MSGMAAVRRYPKSKDRSSGREEIPHIQGKEKQLHFSGEAVKRYCTSKVREVVGTERGHQRADRLKPQSQKTSQSDNMDHSLF